MPPETARRGNKWEEGKFAWVNGRIIPSRRNVIRVATPAVQYARSGFGGVRYRTLENGQRGVFRLPDHLRRFENTAHTLGLQIPFTTEQIREAVFEVIRRNRRSSGYVRPWVGADYGHMGVDPGDSPVRTVVTEWAWGDYLPNRPNSLLTIDPGQISIHAGSIFPEAKVAANYPKSTRAKGLAQVQGYDEALIYASDGNVAEASAQNVFALIDDELHTPEHNILKGFTRDTVMQLAKLVGIKVLLRPDLQVQELYGAREVFLAGTASGVVPVGSIDGNVIGSGGVGELTREIQKLYDDAVFGRDPRFAHWISIVPEMSIKDRIERFLYDTIFGKGAYSGSGRSHSNL